MIKVNVKDEEQYCKLVKELGKIENIQWHSSEYKQYCPVRVIANKLHHTCNLVDIKDELRRRGYKKSYKSLKN